MFRMLFGNSRGATCKPVKSHAPGSKREQYSNFTLKTLGTGDLIATVKLPPGEDLNEWFAANTVDFFNEIRIIWDIVCEEGVEAAGPGQGFPPGFEYRWADPRAKGTISCSGPQYVDYAMNWIEAEIANESLFPVSASTPFPKTFLHALKVIYTRIFRVFAIIYSHHFSKLERIGASFSHLNTSFKHFVFFIWENDLVQQGELEALHDIVTELKSRYGSAFASLAIGGSSPGAGPVTSSEKEPSHSEPVLGRGKEKKASRHK